MRIKEEMDKTTNVSVFRRVRKRYLEMYEDLHCSYCKYHRGENRHWRRHTPWKEIRRHQWRDEQPTVKWLDLIEEEEDLLT